MRRRFSSSRTSSGSICTFERTAMSVERVKSRGEVNRALNDVDTVRGQLDHPDRRPAVAHAQNRLVLEVVELAAQLRRPGILLYITQCLQDELFGCRVRPRHVEHLQDAGTQVLAAVHFVRLDAHLLRRAGSAAISRYSLFIRRCVKSLPASIPTHRQSKSR